jgi:hypothetical protein
MSDLVRLEWTRWPDGFEVEKGRLLPVKRERSESYVLEGTDQRVFIDLANVRDEVGALAFTDRWGPLVGIIQGVLVGVPLVAGLIKLAEKMDDAADAVRRDPDAAIAGHAILRGKGTDLQWRWAKLVGDSAPRLFQDPGDLWGFCVSELFQSINGGIQIRRCLRCGNHIALGKVGKPPLHCRPACKKAMYRKRKREAEQRASNMVSLRRSAAR